MCSAAASSKYECKCEWVKKVTLGAIKVEKWYKNAAICPFKIDFMADERLPADKSLQDAMLRIVYDFITGASMSN